MSPLRTRLSQAVGLTMVASGLLLLPTSSAHAVPGVFISELHYDNVGTDSGEFVEVTAPAGTDLTGYQVVLYNGNGGASYDTDALSGTVADQQDGWGTAVVDYPANGIQNGAPDGVALVADGTVVEFLSYEGAMTATNGPASGQTATDIVVSEPDTTPIGQSLQRLVDGSWTGPAADTKGTPNGYGAVDDSLAAQDPGEQSGTVGVALTPFDLTASGGEEPYTWAATGLPDGVTVSTSGTVSGTPEEAGDFAVTATVTDAAEDENTVDFTLAIRATDLTIAEIQGTGEESPLSGTQSTRGVVTAAYADGGLRGFYLQTPGTGGEIDLDAHEASDGIFVYQGNVPVTVTPGDYVRVTGTVGS
ncbi:MAG: hypothetical protein WBP61_12860, partial [Nocardioides sp.]